MKSPRLPSQRRSRARQQSLRFLPPAPHRPDPRLRRALPGASAGSRHLLAEMKLDTTAIAAGLLHDSVEDTIGHDRGDQGRVRRAGRSHRRRRHQDQQDRLCLARRAAGGKRPQDDAGHGGRHPRRPHQAGRPSAQHAHARASFARAAAEDRARDAGDLRSRSRIASAWARSAANSKTSRFPMSIPIATSR